MTYIYQYFQFPAEFSVECPRCKSESRGNDVSTIKKRWGSKGSEYISRTSLGAEKGTFVCNISCLNCGFKNKRLISWPENAYWKFNIKGQVLWAWSRDHAREIALFLKSKERKPFKFRFIASLHHIPKHFKLAKNRDIVIRQIERKLNEGI